MTEKGKVWLVGAGPGDIGLLTMKAVQLIKEADFIAYDALVGEEILCLLPEETEKISVGKRAGAHSVPQEETNQILLEEALKGKKVVRLKGGDPFVFGRGGEELELLVQNDIPFEVVPGVTSAVSVPAYNGIPVTHRDYTSSFHVITGHPRKDGNDRIDYASLVKLDATLVFLMSLGAMGLVMENLMKNGMDPMMPAAVLEKGTTYRQRRVVSTVSTIEKDAKEAGIETPAIIIVGRVCSLSEDFAWYEKRPLAGKQILVTRARSKASKLSENLRKLGAQVLEIPMIECKEKDAQEVDLSCLYEEDVHTERWLTFTSPFGVEVFFKLLAAKKKDLRTLFKSGFDVRFAAIGSATAAELGKYGWVCDLLPEVYNGGELGRLMSRELSDNAKVYLLRAEKGSQELLDELEAGGIAYQDIAIYQTVCRTESELTEFVKAKVEAGLIDRVTFTSASTVQGFVQTFAGMDFTKVRGLCIGEQTAREAIAAGIQVEISDKATINSMIDKLLELA